jgi:betaine-aldehyde dehydrogenase
VEHHGHQTREHQPATGEVIGHYADGNAETAQAAIDAAQTAFETGPWREDPFLRATALCRLADAYEARTGEIIETLAIENGKMKYEAGFEAHFIPRALRFATGLAMHNFGRVAEIRPGVQSMSIREPVGVAGMIIPWNSPAYLSIRALVPALAAGCTAAVKMPTRPRRPLS